MEMELDVKEQMRGDQIEAKKADGEGEAQTQ